MSPTQELDIEQKKILIVFVEKMLRNHFVEFLTNQESMS